MAISSSATSGATTWGAIRACVSWTTASSGRCWTPATTATGGSLPRTDAIVSDSSKRERVLGLIPAKGGSTRLTKQNIRQLGDRSLLAWTAEAGRTSGVIDRLVVSTEDEEVAAAAQANGLAVTFMRPHAHARDPAGLGPR